MHLNGSVYKMIDPSTAVRVTVGRASRGTALRDSYYATDYGDWLKKNIQYPDAPDFTHLSDRFFWMIWEVVCKIEATQFDRIDWGVL